VGLGIYYVYRKRIGMPLIPKFEEQPKVIRKRK